MMKVSGVVPAYNEADSLPFLRQRLLPVLQQFPDWELVVVSDGSTDHTAKIVRDWAAADPHIHLVELRRNQGKSAALMAGFAKVSGDRVVMLDADLQDQPEEIPRLLAALDEQDVDMVTGWKQDRRDPWIKLVSSKIFNAIANRALHTSFHDLNSGLKVYRRAVVDGLDLYGDLYRFIPLLAVTNGWRVIEMPVKHQAREHGVSKYGLRLNGIFDVISLLMVTRYRFKPLHFFGRWGLLLLAIGLIIMIYLTIQHFLGHAIADRPLLIFGLLFILSGLQLLFTGLLGDLIVQRRP